MRSPVVVELETLDEKKVSKAYMKDLKLKVCKQINSPDPPTTALDEPVPNQVTPEIELGESVKLSVPNPITRPRRGRPCKNTGSTVPLNSGTAEHRPSADITAESSQPPILEPELGKGKRMVTGTKGLCR